MNTFVHKVETTVENWLKPLPHLPEVARKWLAENVWWIVLVGAILTSISVLVQVGGVFTTIAAISSAAVWLAYYVGPVYTWWGVTVQLVSVVLFAAVAALMWLAVKPLQDVKKKGWDLLLLTLLADLAIVVIVNVLGFGVFSIFSIIFGAIAVAIGGYFLFEIRSRFAVTTKKKTKSTPKKSSKK